MEYIWALFVFPRPYTIVNIEFPWYCSTPIFTGPTAPKALRLIPLLSRDNQTTRDPKVNSWLSMRTRILQDLGSGSDAKSWFQN